MGLAHKKQSSRSQLRKTKRYRLPIGLRLSLAFMALILLTALIGILAIQQISSLTNKATELNARDLPEAITMEQLRTLLYRQDDLEHSLINGDILFPDQLSTFSQQGTSATKRQDASTIASLNKADLTPTPNTGNAPGKQMQEIVSELATVIKGIQSNCQQLLAFERSEQGEDLALVQQVADAALKTDALSERIQTLVKHEQMAQARVLDFTQQEPLLLSAITTVTRLSSLEQAENANDTAQTQQDSGRSILFVFALTAFCLLLSIVLAIIITRSLTRPLKAILHTTKAIAAGDLNVEPRVERSEEIGRLASAYDEMRLSLRSTIARLRQERQQTQAIIDATADGIILVDEEQKIVKCNPAAEHLSGWRANEATGRYCWEVLGFKETSVKAAQANEQLFPLME